MMTSQEILSALNPGQSAAVVYNDGPQLIIAGAGSGKTRVLTYKIAYLIQQGLAPWNILALTFTNKAAGEMKERIARLVGDEHARYIRMGTFHSVFVRILRAEAKHIGYTSNFTIYDESDSRSLLKSIIKEQGLDDKEYKPATVHARISMAKNHLIGSFQYMNDAETQSRDSATKTPAIGKIFNLYEQRCKAANAMDFDDLLVLTHHLLFQHEDVRKKYADLFKYVLVDEYQDTNYVQQRIIELLAREHRHICVVGDDAQSIYAFRGANIDNILDFNRTFPGAQMFKLEQNYRSTQRIVEAANSLIDHNSRQIRKKVFSENAEGEKLVVLPTYSDKEEAAVVCKDIQRIKRQDHVEYSSFAVLYRTNAQSRSFEEELRKQNIPYRIYGGLSFYQRKEIKDVVAYLRLLINPNDEEALRRVINYPTRGIGDSTITKVSQAALMFSASMWDVIIAPERFQLQVSAGVKKKLNEFVYMIQSLMEMLPTADAQQMVDETLKRSRLLETIYSSHEPEDISRQENIEEFRNAVLAFVEGAKEEGRMDEVSLTDFLQDISLQTDLESEEDDSAKVTLMTVHAAKGLEFYCVYIVGLEENIFPSQMALNSLRELEEERRLLYVAITRAEKYCTLTWAQNRFRYGHLEFGTPSRFLKDIDRRLIDVQANAAGRYGNYSSSTDTPYRGTRTWGSDYPDYGARMQNSRPVASQFRADPKPKITSPQRPERPVDPFSESFKRQLAEAKQKRSTITVSGKMPPNARPVSTIPYTPGSASSNASVKVGNIIEHQRFGIGEVTAIEGTGENTKATVEFKNLGRKQLLLKFAKFTIIK